MSKIKSYKDLLIWQKAIDLDIQINIANKLGYLRESSQISISNEILELRKMIFGLIKRLS